MKKIEDDEKEMSEEKINIEKNEPYRYSSSEPEKMLTEDEYEEPSGEQYKPN